MRRPDGLHAYLVAIAVIVVVTAVLCGVMWRWG